jgi:hypothetical protein
MSEEVERMRFYPDINRLQGLDPVTNTKPHSNEKWSNIMSLLHRDYRPTLKHHDF